MNLEGGKIITVQKAKKDSEKSTKVVWIITSYNDDDEVQYEDDDDGQWHTAQMWQKDCF